MVKRMDTANGTHVTIVVKQCRSCTQASGRMIVFMATVSESINLNCLFLGKEELPWQTAEGEMKNGGKNGKVTVYKDDDTITNEEWKNN